MTSFSIYVKYKHNSSLSIKRIPANLINLVAKRINRESKNYKKGYMIQY